MDDPRDKDQEREEASLAGSEGESHREDNLDILRRAAAAGARAEPRDRTRVLVPAAEVRRERLPRWLLPVLVVILVALTAGNLSGFGPFRSLPAEPSDAEIEASVERTTEMEAEWVESYRQAYGELPAEGDSFDLEGLGRFAPSGGRSFRLILEEPDGWTGVYDSSEGAVRVSGRR